MRPLDMEWATVSGGKDIGGGGIDLSALPEGCIANILSFTSPPDVCRLSLVSSVFWSAAKSDAVWECFLPVEYDAIISSSLSPIPASFSSKKDIYLHLCENPILIDGGNKSFSLDKNSGKTQCMLSVRDLFIVWGDTSRYWKWTSHPGKWFTERAVLNSACWLEIRGKINTGILSPFTLYVAYLVFKPTTGAYRFQDQPVDVAGWLVGTESDTKSVYLDTERKWESRLTRSRMPSHILQVDESGLSERIEGGRFPKERTDGWLEIELGEFFHKKDDKDLEMSVEEIKSGAWKRGLIIQGIEIRPKIGHVHCEKPTVCRICRLSSNLLPISRKKCAPRKSDDGELPVLHPSSVLVKSFKISDFNGKWYITSGLNPAFQWI